MARVQERIAGTSTAPSGESSVVHDFSRIISQNDQVKTSRVVSSRSGFPGDAAYPVSKSGEELFFIACSGTSVYAVPTDGSA